MPRGRPQLWCPRPACGERASEEFPHGLSGEGPDTAPHPSKFVERLALRSPRKRGEGASASLALAVTEASRPMPHVGFLHARIGAQIGEAPLREGLALYQHHDVIA